MRKAQVRSCKNIFRIIDVSFVSFAISHIFRSGHDKRQNPLKLTSSCLSWIRWWSTRCGMEVAFPTSLPKLPRSNGNAWPHQSSPFRGSQTKRLSTLPPTTFCKHQGTDSEAIFPLFFLDFGELEVFTLRCNLRMCFPQVANDVKS